MSNFRWTQVVVAFGKEKKQLYILLKHIILKDGCLKLHLNLE